MFFAKHGLWLAKAAEIHIFARLEDNRSARGLSRMLPPKET